MLKSNPANQKFQKPIQKTSVHIFRNHQFILTSCQPQVFYSAAVLSSEKPALAKGI